MKKVLTAGVVAALAMTMVPGGASPGHRDLSEVLVSNAQRYVPQPAGATEDYTFLFGPFLVPPGWDANRITIDIPFKTGFLQAVAPDLILLDPNDDEGSTASLGSPSEQHAHIHHAHWFEIQPDKPARGAAPQAMKWIFGTGEEKTQGRFDDRQRFDEVNAEGKTIEYGIPIDGTKQQVLIYMLHNKTQTSLQAYVALDVTFLHGSEAEVEAAGDVDLRPTVGTLWGQTADATAAYPYLWKDFTMDMAGIAVASGGHLHPGGKATVVTNIGPGGMCAGTDPDLDGYPGVTILNSHKYDRIGDAGVYTEDYQIGVSKFGWRAPVHEGDVLRQIAPYAIYPSLDDVPADRPNNSLETALTEPQWDALKAKLVSQDGLPHAWFEGMTYTGIYVDQQAAVGGLPETSDPPTDEDLAAVCTVANFAPDLLGDDDFDTQGRSVRFPAYEDASEWQQVALDDMQARYNLYKPAALAEDATQGMINHLWLGADPLCGPRSRFGIGDNDPVPDWYRGVCEPPTAPTWAMGGGPVENIHIASFAYLPGDLLVQFPGNEVPTVEEGTQLRFINEDAAANIRHSITSCPEPCNGPYVSNYPVPDGTFDSGKLGNFDYIDGGLQVEDSAEFLVADLFGEDSPLLEGRNPNHVETVPYWYLDTTGYSDGVYTYFCRIHPWMRGAFEVAPTA